MNTVGVKKRRRKLLSKKESQGKHAKRFSRIQKVKDSKFMLFLYLNNYDLKNRKCAKMHTLCAYIM